MDQVFNIISKIVPYAPLIAICLGFISLIISFILFIFQKSIQSREVKKSNAMGDVFFLYEATPKIYKANDKKVIELEVKVSNQSLNKLAILAIFVRFKPIIDTSNQNTILYKDFDSLDDFANKDDFERDCSLLKYKNIAFAKGFFWQTSVNGVTVRRGFDIVSEEFCKKYPLIMAQIIIYGSSTNLIDKSNYPKYNIGKLRMRLCNYLNEKYLENYNFFSRMGPQGYRENNLHALSSFKIKEGERILVNKDGSLDIKNTKLFFPVLTSVINSNIEKVIDLQ